MDHLELVCNGKVGRELELNPDRESADIEQTIPVTRSGWCLLRAWSEKAEHPILDAYPYATTSPIYLSVDGSRPESAEDAAYFVAWIDRLSASAKSNPDWNNDAEKASVMTTLDSARKIYLGMQK